MAAILARKSLQAGNREQCRQYEKIQEVGEEHVPLKDSDEAIR